MRAPERVIKLHDRWPHLTFDIELPPGTKATYDFHPDSPRARVRKSVRLRADGRGGFTPPRPRTSGLCAITLHYPNGEQETLMQDVRFVR